MVTSPLLLRPGEPFCEEVTSNQQFNCCTYDPPSTDGCMKFKNIYHSVGSHNLGVHCTPCFCTCFKTVLFSAYWATLNSLPIALRTVLTLASGIMRFFSKTWRCLLLLGLSLSPSIIASIYQGGGGVLPRPSERQLCGARVPSLWGSPCPPTPP